MIFRRARSRTSHARVSKPSPIRLVLILAVLLLGAAEARAHLPPFAYLSMTLDDEKLVQQLTLRTDLFHDWTDLEAEKFRPPEGEVSVEISKQDLLDLAKAHATWMGVTVDGVEIDGVVSDAVTFDIYDHQAKWGNINLTVTYGILGNAKQVAFLWRRFENALGANIAPVDVELEAHGIMDYAALHQREPGWIWHAPLEKKDRAAVMNVAPAPVAAVLDLPLASVTLILFAILAVPVMARLGASRREIAVAVVTPLLAATLLWGETRVKFDLPWEGGYSRPDEERAAALFTELHRNIYRAFAFTTEDAIYETLARTVEGELLDEVYAEIYQSLILKDQGGAVCVVHGTEVLETDVEYPADEEQREFDVTSRWRVKGTVTHYGHKHVRMNEYRAKYTVRWRDGGWKISAAETLGQKRVALDD